MTIIDLASELESHLFPLEFKLARGSIKKSRGMTYENKSVVVSLIGNGYDAVDYTIRLSKHTADTSRTIRWWCDFTSNTPVSVVIAAIQSALESGE